MAKTSTSEHVTREDQVTVNRMLANFLTEWRIRDSKHLQIRLDLPCPKWSSPGVWGVEILTVFFFAGKHSCEVPKY